MKKILLFNHKGGVSKTTSTFHIGWKIAELGHKVLLVDADPQCNLTALFLGDKFDPYYESETTKKNNLKDGVGVAFDSSAIKAIEAFDCPQSTRNNSLFLLPGHMNISEYESQLNFAMTAPLAFPALKNLPGSFNDLITKICEKYGIEYVFIDLNPGLSALNRILFLCSDAFIVPTNPDTFSLMALNSLSKILPEWVDWKNQHIADFSGAAYPLPESIPRFIGEIPQRFNVRNGRATTQFAIKIDALTEIIISVLVPSLRKKGMLFPEEAYDAAGIDRSTYCLEEIKDFLTLAPKSFGANVPVFALTDEELEATGMVLETAQTNREIFNQLYTRLANKIITLLLQ